jgi:hypothetical protein
MQSHDSVTKKTESGTLANYDGFRAELQWQEQQKEDDYKQT